MLKIIYFCRCLIECREEYRYNLEAVDYLIRAHLVNMQQYDLHLAQAMENGLNYMTVHFAMQVSARAIWINEKILKVSLQLLSMVYTLFFIQLVQRFCIDDKHASQISEADFYSTIETLSRIATHSRQAPEGYGHFLTSLVWYNIFIHEMKLSN